DEDEAYSTKGRVEYLLMRLKQNLLTLPAGMDICTFLLHDGKPPDTYCEPARRETAFSEFRDEYVRTFSNGALEQNTISTATIHLGHFAESLGEKFPMNALTLADLQRHVDRRQKDVAAVTIKKEVDTLRSAWNWASRMGYVEGEFPGGRLVYPKTDEKLPFMTWKEIDRRIKAGGDASELWEWLFLTSEEIAKLLEFVRGSQSPPWFYPMLVCAAHTGARRGELIRARQEDVDLAGGIFTIREKKRVRGTRTTRR